MTIIIIINAEHVTLDPESSCQEVPAGRFVQFPGQSTCALLYRSLEP